MRDDRPDHTGFCDGRAKLCEECTRRWSPGEHGKGRLHLWIRQRIEPGNAAGFRARRTVWTKKCSAPQPSSIKRTVAALVVQGVLPASSALSTIKKMRDQSGGETRGQRPHHLAGRGVALDGRPVLLDLANDIVIGSHKLGRCHPDVALEHSRKVRRI